MSRWGSGPPGAVVAVIGKGGTGKTTAAGNLAGILARRGANTVLVDLDSTPMLTSWLIGDGLPAAVDDVLAGRVGVDEVRETIRTGVDLVPASTGLSLLEGDREVRRSVPELVGKLRAAYELVMLDCRGGTASELAAAAVATADLAILTVEPSPIGFEAVREAREMTEQLGTPLAGVLPFRRGGGRLPRVARQMLTVLEMAGLPIWPVIRQDVNAIEAVAERALLDDYAPRSNALADLTLAADRLEARL